jgi:hypothetical protein
MEVRFGDHLQRRHGGYLRSDLLTATLRSNREANVFVQRTAHQNFFGGNPPITPSDLFAGIASSYVNGIARQCNLIGVRESRRIHSIQALALLRATRTSTNLRLEREDRTRLGLHYRQNREYFFILFFVFLNPISNIVWLVNNFF